MQKCMQMSKNGGGKLYEWLFLLYLQRYSAMYYGRTTRLRVRVQGICVELAS